MTWTSDKYEGRWSELDDLYQLNRNKEMQSNIFSLNWKNVTSALVSSVLVSVLMYVGTLTDLANLDWKQVVSIAVLVGANSLLKSFTTSHEGDFLGVVPIK